MLQRVSLQWLSHGLRLHWQRRAASIDRGIFLEAAAVGLRTREVEGTRKAVPGGLEGAVYEVCRLLCWPVVYRVVPDPKPNH